VRFGQILLRNSGDVLLPWGGILKETSLSRQIGSDDGEFRFPLSLAVGPNQRIYVLDAGNARIQVFDSQGQYLTQWGRPGSGPGEFDFGTGLSADDFAGSIVVDDDGFVDVADVGNRRIQKFAR